MNALKHTGQSSIFSNKNENFWVVYVPSEKSWGLSDKILRISQFVLVQVLKIGYQIEGLLEIKFGYLEIFYVSWLWSKSCVQTSSFGVKDVEVHLQYQARAAELGTGQISPSPPFFLILSPNSNNHQLHRVPWCPWQGLGKVRDRLILGLLFRLALKRRNRRWWFGGKWWTHSSNLKHGSPVPRHKDERTDSWFVSLLRLLNYAQQIFSRVELWSPHASFCFRFSFRGLLCMRKFHPTSWQLGLRRRYDFRSLWRDGGLQPYCRRWLWRSSWQ